MSGGVAFVLDEDGKFAERCNQAMVDLEPIADEDEALEELEHRGGDLEAHGFVDCRTRMNERDAKLLQAPHRPPCAFTQSPQGAGHPRRLGRRWRPRFVKVMPIEYRRALQQIQARPRATERADVSVAVGR